jgi:hypothetical protein
VSSEKVGGRTESQVDYSPVNSINRKHHLTHGNWIGANTKDSHHLAASFQETQKRTQR